MFTGVCVCVLAMDFEFILKVAERRIKAALGNTEAGKTLFTLRENWGERQWHNYLERNVIPAAVVTN